MDLCDYMKELKNRKNVRNCQKIAISRIYFRVNVIYIQYQKNFSETKKHALVVNKWLINHMINQNLEKSEKFEYSLSGCTNG